MTSPALPPPLDRSFRDATRIHGAGAYKLAAERIYLPDQGFGPLMFALGVYFNLTHRFSQIFGPGSGPLRFVRTMRQAELHGPGELRVRWNKTGSELGQLNELERPSETLIEMAATNMVPQLSLGLSNGVAQNWIIAHAGNASDGLLTMHLASPIMSRGGSKVIGWREAIPIFDARHPGTDFPDIDSPGLPEPPDLGDLDLRFRDDAPQTADAEDGEEEAGSDAE